MTAARRCAGDLTLRVVGGLTAREIARAFLVGEETVSQRILRAKRGSRRQASRMGFPRLSPAPNGWARSWPCCT
ncbi:sigma factor-like helix-turn-helix DNA-binding protein [Streptomyces sp. NPDC057074]|uniref:sigma factor-like helix-turn-helix DNA-binding protein n=1 Tax=Streptomyces sp. NPDC057074 TaxID=3346015 RepID=UPI00363D30FC